MPSSFCTFCDPNTGSTLRSDFGTSHNVGTIFGNCAAILGGIPSATPTNLNCADLSVIVMGDSNCICLSGAGNGCYNFIGNGNAHLVTGSNNFLGGGNNNQINSFVGSSVFGSVIVGGENNLICDNGSIIASDSFIGGGSDHHVYGAKSVVAGGLHNYVYSSCSFIGGGACNNIHLCYDMNTIVGGCQNSIGSSITSGSGFTVGYSIIGGGVNNCIDSTPTGISKFDFIGGGICNRIYAGSSCSAIAGGYRNWQYGNNLSIGGGADNHLCSIIGPISNATIAGGNLNCICDNGTVTADNSFIGGGRFNSIFGFNATIAGGSNNIACGQYSFVGGGGGNTAAAGNVAIGDSTFIGGGFSNQASCNGSFIGGGGNHFVCGNSSIISGGISNCICSNSFLAIPVHCATISGGQANLICDNSIISADYSFIGGGHLNCVFGVASVVTGGQANNSAGASSFIGGGAVNLVMGNNSFVGGGGHNTAGGNYTFVGGGGGHTPALGNTANGDTSFIGGGTNNQSFCTSSFIGGGSNHTLAGNASFIGRGDINVINSGLGLPVSCATITAGWCNTICDDGSVTADYSYIGGGACNIISGQYSFIGGGGSVTGGLGNTINCCNSFIGAGFGNIISGDASVIVGGGCNLASGYATFVGGGLLNCATGNYAGIGSGCFNYSSDYSFTAAGLCNSASNISFVGAGLCNSVTGFHSFEGSGECNIVGSACSGIVAGFGNNISAGPFNAIGAGFQNCIATVSGGGAELNFIGAGCQNSIFQGSYGNAIGAGYLNQIGAVTHIGAAFSFIGSGQNNCIDTGTNPDVSTWDAIGAGQNNRICMNVCSSGVFVGDGNIIAANCSFIGGGNSNFIDSSSASPTTYAIIGGGQGNKVCAGTNHSGIFSGYQNCVSGSCSVVLGGSGNNDGGYNYVGLFGCNVTGLMPQALHINELVIQNIPLVTTALGWSMLVSGQVYTTGTPNSGLGLSPLYVK